MIILSASNPAKSIAENDFLTGFCSQRCLDATTSIPTNLTAQCNNEFIFSRNVSATIWSEFLGDVSVKDMATTFSNIQTLTCLKSTDGKFCSKTAIEKVTASGKTVTLDKGDRPLPDTTYAGFGTFPPSAYAGDKDVVCNGNCADQQLKFFDELRYR
jgi:hypothetical protein